MDGFHILSRSKGDKTVTLEEWLVALISLSSAATCLPLPPSKSSLMRYRGPRILYNRGFGPFFFFFFCKQCAACMGQQQGLCALLKRWGMEVVNSLKLFLKCRAPSSEGGWADGAVITLSALNPWSRWSLRLPLSKYDGLLFAKIQLNVVPFTAKDVC